MINLSTAPSFSDKALTKKGRYTQGKKDTNAYSREYGSSPVFSFAVPEVLSGAEYLIDFYQDKPAMQKYGAMDNFIVTNNSSSTITVYLNQSRSRYFIIPAGVIRSFEKKDIQGGVLSLIVGNAGATTINASEVIIETFKVGVEVEDSFAKLHKKFFKLGGF